MEDREGEGRGGGKEEREGKPGGAGGRRKRSVKSDGLLQTLRSVHRVGSGWGHMESQGA